TVLACTGLGDDPVLADTLREQRLAQYVVDLVRPGVVEVLALEDDAGAPGVLGEARDLGDDRGPPRVGRAEAIEFGLECRIGFGGGVGDRELVERLDERLWHESAAELAEVRPVLLPQ